MPDPVGASRKEVFTTENTEVTESREDLLRALCGLCGCNLSAIDGGQRESRLYPSWATAVRFKIFTSPVTTADRLFPVNVPLGDSEIATGVCRCRLLFAPSITVIPAPEPGPRIWQDPLGPGSRFAWLG